jgi:hypothetical protein
MDCIGVLLHGLCFDEHGDYGHHFEEHKEEQIKPQSFILIYSKMSNSFYVIVPSNAPGFSDNKTNKFKVRLPKKLQFDGTGWVVGMSGIIYPNRFAWNDST